MKEMFDSVSISCSRTVTKTYSTSFSLGIFLLDKKYRDPIYSIYGFVRFADEIVDSFHNYNKEDLLKTFKEDTYKAISNGISLNPILNSFQCVVNQYKIDHELIEAFLQSMEMDLHKKQHSQVTLEEYIYGSAEVVGLMCLTVFSEGDRELYDRLKKPARVLGSAFQKVNFLRDLHADYKQLGRSYFPELHPEYLDSDQKLHLEQTIHNEFEESLIGIKQLPNGARLGVYLAYAYYRALFQKIRSNPSENLINQRIRIPNEAKIGIMINSYIRYRLNIL